MTNFSIEVWCAMGAVGGTAILSVLYLAATTVRDRHQLHELRQKVERLRVEYTRRNTELAAAGVEVGGEEMGEVTVDVVAEPPRRRAA